MTSSADKNGLSYTLSLEGIAHAGAQISALCLPYQALMMSSEGGEHLLEMALGFSSDLERKSTEPIALRLGVEPRVLQGFMGISTWAWDPVRQMQRRDVTSRFGCEDAAMIFDGSSIGKKGKATVGVKRQWCGSKGKVENCVTGVHAIFAGKENRGVLVDSQLYLGSEWLTADRRAQAHIPAEVKHATIPELAASMMRGLANEMSFKWALADSEFGRSADFRATARELGKSYVAEVPKNTVVERMTWGGFAQAAVSQWAVRVPQRRFEDLKIRPGTNGVIRGRAAMVPVWTTHGNQRIREILLILQRPDEEQPHYFLCSGPKGTTLLEFVQQSARRHVCEEVFAECKGDLGMDHFELRAFHGWHHHMTIVQMCHFFHAVIRRELAEKFQQRISMSMVKQIVAQAIRPGNMDEITARWFNRQMAINAAEDERIHREFHETATPSQ